LISEGEIYMGTTPVLRLGFLAGLTSMAFAGPYTYTTINPGTDTNAAGINNAGQIVGFYLNTVSFVDTAGTVSTFSDPAGNGGTQAAGINNGGQIVGLYNDGIPDPPSAPFGTDYGFIDTAGAFTHLGCPAAGINDAGQVVGTCAEATPYSGFLYSAGTYTYFAGDEFTGINNAGQIVGRNSSGGFLDTGGIFTTINDPSAPPALGSTVSGINNTGEMVGYYYSGVADPPYFPLYGPNVGFLDDGGIFTTISDPLATDGTTPLGINDAGQIVGYYNDGAVQYGFLATPETSTAPEPATFATMLSAMLAIAVCCRRRRATHFSRRIVTLSSHRTSFDSYNQDRESRQPRHGYRFPQVDGPSAGPPI
jgi:uncharacterized membrane protein